jgi:DNA-binding MarR family transcriptional regulator
MDASADTRTPTLLLSRPSWLITHISTHVGRLLGDAFDSGEWRRYHYALLAALDEFGPASQADLGRRCDIDRSYIVEAINELASRDLVVRAPDPTDRRRNVITITTGGLRQLQRLSEVLDGVQDDLLAPLSPAERTQFVTMLARVLDHQARG